jgi:serine/threonine protein kinase
MTTTNGGGHVQFAEPALSERSVPPPPPTPTPQSTPPPPQDGAGSTPKFQAKNLRGNLMREIVDRDPLFNYEVISVLGVGSMGSVAKVRKRGSAIGGSARKELRDHFRREKKLKECATIPFFGSMFKHCLRAVWQDDLGSSDGVDNNNNNNNTSTHSSATSSILSPRANALQRVESLDTSDTSKYELIYAMKSIHLSRVTDPTFIEELRNEVRILKRVRTVFRKD